jgi:hypothetical protein
MRALSEALHGRAVSPRRMGAHRIIRVVTTPRLHRHLARLVLAWFLAFVAVATAAPAVDAQPLGDICTSSSAPSGSQDGGSAAGGHLLHCALCAAVPAPAPQATRQVAAPDALAHAVQPVAAARVAALTRAPLPARGPPPLA